MPTGRLTAHDERTSVKKLPQAFLLTRGQLRRTTAAVTIHQAVEAREQKGLVPGIETRRAEVPALTYHRHGHRGHQEVAQHSAPSHQTRSIASIGLLKTAVEVFDGRPTELYIEAYGSILLVGYAAIVF
jgi:hypothetical protein